MPDSTPARSVKIDADERTGWSSERPRREGAPVRPPDISSRCRVLTPAYRLRYSPGSLLIVIGPVATEPAAFAGRVVAERGVVILRSQVTALLAGRVTESELEERSAEVLTAAITRRLQQNDTVVLATESLDSAQREPYLRLAHQLRRPRHAILLDAGRDEVSGDERPALDEMRRALDAGELGLEGFQTALRLSRQAREELKRVIFQRPPRDD